MRSKLGLIIGVSLGSSVAFADDHIEISPTAQLQVWTTLWDQDQDPTADPAGYGDPENDPGFSIRRGRIGIEANYGSIEGLFQMGIGAPYDALTSQNQDVQIANAYVRGSLALGPGTARIGAGMIKVPFSREGIMSSVDLTFQERAVHTAWMAPIQDLGVLADWTADFGLTVSAGVFNGGGSLFGDDNSGLLYGGRVEYNKGDTYRTYTTNDPFAIGVGFSTFFNDDVATETLAFEADVMMKVRAFHLMAEFAQSQITPGNTDIDVPEVLNATTRRGISAQLGYTIPLGDGGLEIASRIGLYDDAISLKDNGDVLISHTGLTAHNVAPTLDVGLGFIHREELQGRSLSNDTIRLWTQFNWPVKKTTGCCSED